MYTERASHVAAPIYDAMVILGGPGLSSVEFIYPGSGTRGTGANMPTQMNYMGGAASGDGDNQRIYIIGGVKYNAWNRSCNEAEYLSYCYQLDPFTWQWYSCKAMPTARADLSVVSLDNKLYAIGGGNCSGKTNAVEVYDPAFNSWTSVNPMLTRADNTAAVTVDGKIYVFYADDGQINVEEYDPKREN
jgi:hypothetical protein